METENPICKLLVDLIEVIVDAPYLRCTTHDEILDYCKHDYVEYVRIRWEIMTAERKIRKLSAQLLEELMCHIISVHNEKWYKMVATNMKPFISDTYIQFQDSSGEHLLAVPIKFSNIVFTSKLLDFLASQISELTENTDFDELLPFAVTFSIDHEIVLLEDVDLNLKGERVLRTRGSDLCGLKEQAGYIVPFDTMSGFMRTTGYLTRRKG